MIPEPQIEPEVSQTPEGETRPDSKDEKILCPHCLRTATNGIKCQGMCVADNGY